MLRRLFNSTFFIPVVGTLAVILAWIGWRQAERGYLDAFFYAIDSLAVGDFYKDSTDLEKGEWNIYLEISRWLGLIFLAWAVGKTVGLLFADRLKAIGARLKKPDIVLLGDAGMLAPLAEHVAQGRKTLWLHPGMPVSVPGATVVSERWHGALPDAYRLNAAKAIVIAYDGAPEAQIAIARSLELEGIKADIIVLARDGDAMEALAHEYGVTHTRVISAEEAAVRRLHERRPPFLAAIERGHTRLHSVIFGWTEASEAVLRDTLLSSLTSDLGKPRCTIFCANPRENAAALALSAPELSEVADITFEGGIVAGEPHFLPADQLRAITAQDPVSRFYVCFDDQRDNLVTAFRLTALVRAEGWNACGIYRFENVRTGSGIDAPEDCDRPIGFGHAEDVAVGLGIVGDTPDRLARALHQAYRDAAPADAPANTPWDELDEDLRAANRRNIVHLPAKLHSAGAQVRSGDAVLPSFPELEEGSALLEKLAELEHDRWMAERRLAGWRHAVTRDDRRRLHPDLVPYEDLSEKARSYDRNVITTLAEALRKT